jgi:hypothetical protein
MRCIDIVAVALESRRHASHIQRSTPATLLINDVRLLVPA